MSNGPLLLVDDEPHNLAALRQVLADDYRLVFARTGRDALLAVEKHRPALILLDVQIPDMDGYAVCRQLKASPHTEHIPVIFITGLTDVGNETIGFETGAVDYIAKPISPTIVRARVKTHLSLVRTTRLENSYRDAIYMLGAAGHYNDTDTGDHIWRMAAYARELAQACGWGAEECRTLELAAPMHDTGKIGIPESILRKPSALTPDEWVIMKSHTVIGHHILSKSDAPVFKLAAEVALRHHEKWNGGGYPDGLSGKDIPESARIVAMADVFDALTMRRPYKDAWPIEQAMATLKASAGSHFEPRLINLFESILPKILEIKQTFDDQVATERARAAPPPDTVASPRVSDPDRTKLSPTNPPPRAEMAFMGAI
jgi:putative two-component system response regulator